MDRCDDFSSALPISKFKSSALLKYSIFLILISINFNSTFISNIKIWNVFFFFRGSNHVHKINMFISCICCLSWTYIKKWNCLFYTIVTWYNANGRNFFCLDYWALSQWGDFLKSKHVFITAKARLSLQYKATYSNQISI